MPMRSRTIAISFTLTLILLLVVVIFLLSAPFLSERYILPAFAEKLPFDRSELSISRITPWSARGTLILGEDDQPGISIARFEAYYSPASLRQGKIASLLVDSATIHLELEGGTPRIRGHIHKTKPSPQKPESSLPVLPITIDRIDLRNTQVAVHMAQESSRYLKMDAELIPTYSDAPDGGYSLAGLKLGFTTWGALKTRGQLLVEPKAGGHSLTFQAELADMGELEPMLPLPSPWQVAGKFTIDGRISITELLNIDDYLITSEAAGLYLRGNGVEVGLAEADRPATLTLQGNLASLTYSVDGLAILQPETAVLETEGMYDVETGSLQGSFQLWPELLAAKLSGEFEGEVGRQTALGYTITGESFTLENGIAIDDYSLVGELALDGDSLSGHLKAAVPLASLPDRKIALRDIVVELPVNFPPVPAGVGQPGKFVINKIQYQNEHVGAIGGEVGFAPEQVNLNLQATTPLHADFSLACSGVLHRHDDADIQCNLPEIAFDASHFPRAISLPDDLQFSGKIGAKLNYTIKNGVHRGDATIIPNDIQVNYNEYSFSGINGSLHFPRLPVIQSSPSQRLTIESLELGKLTMTDARVSFRVDDAETLFVEEARLRWSGGRVEAGALTLYKGMERIETRLYCDRLSYTELLDQFGVGDAEGGGSLNGRLPVVISREGVEFDDGFLFSTPGDSGIVRFSNTQRLRQGMAAMEKTTYLDYSLDALENFAYNWTKLTFDTEGEELLLTLQLDGKPAQPLPYGYQQGQIVKNPGGQGIQHPLRLDVNFRLPMRDLFRYGKSIQSLMENM